MGWPQAGRGSPAAPRATIPASPRRPKWFNQKDGMAGALDWGPPSLSRKDRRPSCLARTAHGTRCARGFVAGRGPGRGASHSRRRKSCHSDGRRRCDTFGDATPASPTVRPEGRFIDVQEFFGGVVGDDSCGGGFPLGEPDGSGAFVPGYPGRPVGLDGPVQPLKRCLAEGPGPGPVGHPWGPWVARPSLAGLVPFHHAVPDHPAGWHRWLPPALAFGERPHACPSRTRNSLAPGLRSILGQPVRCPSNPDFPRWAGGFARHDRWFHAADPWRASGPTG